MIIVVIIKSAPSEPGHPTVEAVNSSTLSVMWEEPTELNGPPPEYTVIQSEVAFSTPPPRVISGTRFPGGGYYLFPPETVPQGVAFTGITYSYAALTCFSYADFFTHCKMNYQSTHLNNMCP